MARWSCISNFEPRRELMMDLKEQVAQAKRLLNQIELMNTDPEHSKKLIYDSVIQLEVVVQTMIVRTINYGE